MTVLALDPGPVESAYVVYDGSVILSHGKIANDAMLNMICRGHEDKLDLCVDLVIEQIRGYGMTAGNETFDTCNWSGKFEAWWWVYRRAGVRTGTHLLPRKTIVTHLCGTVRANDSHVRAALIDRFGGPKKALGVVSKKLKRNEPGPLYGIAGDEWSALAVAVVFDDLKRTGVL